jgi:D-aminoacyl-tRNA deacylase
VKTVVQRVSRAAVRVDGQTIGTIGRGLLVLLGIGKDDTHAETDWMINKLLSLRIFPDEAGKMNRSVTDIGGSLLIVSQFTLYGELRKGTRPSFSDAMPPAQAEAFYNQFMTKLRAATTLPVAEGKFAAMMDVELVNDGPVTIILERCVNPPNNIPNQP